MRSTISILSVAFLSVATGGCGGPTCQSTCNRLYQADECDIQSPGSTRTELLNRCAQECEDALEHPGELNDYSPDEFTPASVSITLDNDKQAAVWMDCVAETACDYLDGGYCAPVW